MGPSTNTTCQQRKLRVRRKNHGGPNATTGVRLAPRGTTFQTRESQNRARTAECGGYRRERGAAAVNKNRALEFGRKMYGSPTWIRTTIHGSKGRCPTVRRSGKIRSENELPLVYRMPVQIAVWPDTLLQLARRRCTEANPGRCRARTSNPACVTRVARVGSTPTGFRQTFLPPPRPAPPRRATAFLTMPTIIPYVCLL